MQCRMAIASACLVACGRFDFDDLPRADARADASDPRLGPCPGSVLFEDTFDIAGPAPLWRISSMSSPIPVTETNSELQFDLAGPFTGETYKGYRTLARYPIAELCLVVEVTQVPTGNTTSAYFKLFDTTRVAEVFFFNNGSERELTSRTQVNATGGAGTVDHYVVTTHDPTAHRYWRLHHSAGWTYWDASSDGIQFVELSRLDSVFLEVDAFVEIGAGAETAIVDGGIAGFAHLTANGP
ncbi:MAG TPA: hypothetical protein VIV11_13495 [Kofleriaceae bacterium]